MICIQNGLTFKINENDSTAKVIRSRITNQSIGDIFIPRFINYNSKNYLVTSICEKAFKNNERINIVSFPPDSEIRTIEKKAFLNSSITSINIPKNVKIIEEETFSGCYNLTTVQFPEDSELHSIHTRAFSRTSIKKFYITSKVTKTENYFLHNNTKLTNILISPNNKHFTSYENLFILYKPNLSQESFDELFYSSRLVRKVTIPSFIKHICTCAFNHCQQLQEIEFPDDSQLQSIENGAFEGTLLKRIIIPHHVTKIGERAFYNCSCLTKVEFSEDSELRLISKKAFYKAPIKKLYIASNVEELEEGWCDGMNELVDITISPKNKHFQLINDNKLLLYKSDLSQDKYDKLVFASREIESVFIPSFIKHICSSSFCHCNKLKKIEFEENSELETINDNNFSYSKIEKIRIPSHVKTIGKNFFRFCEQFKSIEIPTDSELISIGKFSFGETKIQSLYIPSNFKEFGKYCFYMLKQLTDISVSPNNKHFTFYNNQFLFYKSDPLNKNYDQLIMASHEIANNIIIPSFIKVIGPYAFHYCGNLISVEFEKNSELQIIDKYAFIESSIQRISLPKSLEKIRNRAFGWCSNLNTIEIPEDSELVSIEQRAFFFTFISNLFIPPKLEELDEPFTDQLTDISVSPKNKNFCAYNGQLLLYRSDPLQKNFDKVIIALSNIENIIIPSFIKYLYPYSFKGCTNIKTIEFQEDSELLYTGQAAFLSSSIESIKIPKHVKTITRHTFQNCNKLKSLEFADDSELISIENSSFGFSTIEKLFLPSKVEKLKENWCISANYLTHISVSPNNKHFTFYNQMLLYKKDENQNTYDNLVFVSRDCEKIVIPSFVKKICKDSFYKCQRLLKVEFENNSQLVAIQNDCFNDSQIESFSIPRSTRIIRSRAFDFCIGLYCIDFQCDEFKEDLLFFACNSLTLTSFPNAHQVNISLRFVSPTFTLFIHPNGQVFV